MAATPRASASFWTSRRKARSACGSSARSTSRRKPSSPPSRSTSRRPAVTDALPRRAEGWAFFLDFDGTLVETADTPDDVSVPHDLPAMLTRLAARAGGALALVSGRTIEALDRLLAPTQFAAAGVHGAELRLPDGERLATAAPD